MMSSWHSAAALIEMPAQSLAHAHLHDFLHSLHATVTKK